MVVEIEHKDVASLQEEYDKLYQEAPIRDEDRAYAWIARQIFKAHPKAASILDVACGGGHFLRQMAGLFTGATCFYGIDLSHLLRKTKHRGNIPILLEHFRFVLQLIPYNTQH